MNDILAILYYFIIFCVEFSSSSPGDNSWEYYVCGENCEKNICSPNGEFYRNPRKQPFFQKLLLWSCRDDCKYHCMWRTVREYGEVMQFHGKWPFVRVLGIQEPASTLFSILNFGAHLYNIKKFRSKVPSDAPMYKLWHLYCLVSLNAWFCSTIFHARDTELTEILDYTSALSIVVMTFYMFLVGLIRTRVPKFVIVIISCIIFSFYYNYVAYSIMDQIDYKYNMILNVTIGTITALGWFVWGTYNRHRKPYAIKIIAFVSLTAVGMVLEVNDFPPILHTFDSHSLWHLYTFPLVFVLYSFAIDDCNYLRKNEIQTAIDHTTKKLD